MKLLPYRKWEIHSPLQVDQLVEGMTRRIEPRKLLRWPLSRYRSRLEGSIHAQGFKVSSVLRYRNGANAILYGTFSPKPGGTTIKVRMTLSYYLWAFLGIWFGLLGLFGLAAIAALLAEGNWLFPPVILGFAAIVGSLISVFFWAEAGETKRLFSNVLRDIHTEAGKGGEWACNPGASL